jgi:hypothetical protein
MSETKIKLGDTFNDNGCLVEITNLFQNDFEELAYIVGRCLEHHNWHVIEIDKSDLIPLKLN